MNKLNISEALTWDEIADEYDDLTGGTARIKPMDAIFQWAKNQTNKFHYNENEGTIHKILNKHIMSNKKQQLVDNILDLIAMLDKGDQFATKQQAITLAEEFSDSYTGSPLDLYLIAKRVENVASAILTKDLKEAAYTEFTLRYGEEKAEHRGNEITPVCGYKKYEYPDDEYINKVEKDLEQVEKQMKPLKDKQKSIKNSIKARQKELEEAGKATLISQTKTLRG